MAEFDFEPRNERERAAINIFKLREDVNNLPGESGYKTYLEGYLESAVEAYRETYKSPADYNKPFAFNYLNESDFIHEQTMNHLDDVISGMTGKQADKIIPDTAPSYPEVLITHSNSKDPYFREGTAHTLNKAFLEHVEKRKKALSGEEENIDMQISVKDADGPITEHFSYVISKSSVSFLDNLADSAEKQRAYSVFAENAEDEKKDRDSADRKLRIINEARNSIEKGKSKNYADIRALYKDDPDKLRLLVASDKDYRAFHLFIEKEIKDLQDAKREAESQRLKAWLSASVLSAKKLLSASASILTAIRMPSVFKQYRFFMERMEKARYRKQLRIEARRRIADIRTTTRKQIRELDGKINGAKREEKLLEKPNEIFNGQKVHQSDIPTYEERVVERIIQQQFPQNYGLRIMRTDNFKTKKANKEDQPIADDLEQFVNAFKLENAKYTDGDKLTNYGYVALRNTLLEKFKKAREEISKKDLSRFQQMEKRPHPAPFKSVPIIDTLDKGQRPKQQKLQRQRKKTV